MSDGDLYCLSMPFRQATSVRNFRTSTVLLALTVLDMDYFKVAKSVTINIFPKQLFSF